MCENGWMDGRPLCRRTGLDWICPRLYLSQTSQPNIRWKALGEIYQVYMRPFLSPSPTSTIQQIFVTNFVFFERFIKQHRQCFAIFAPMFAET